MTYDEELLIKRIESGMTTVDDAKKVRKIFYEKETLAAKLYRMRQKLASIIREIGG